MQALSENRSAVSKWLRQYRSQLNGLGWLLCAGLMLVGCDQSSDSGAPPVSASGLSGSPELSQHVGSSVCAECHADVAKSWAGSHHKQAMEPVSPDTVKGDFTALARVSDKTEIQFSTENGRYLAESHVRDEQGPNLRSTDFHVDSAGEHNPVPKPKKASGALSAQVTSSSANPRLLGASVEFRFTFGTHPLQQYLVDVGAGRLQAYPVVWDARDVDTATQLGAADPGAISRGWYHLLDNAGLSSSDPQHWLRDGQNWNHMCADCHVTQAVKNYDFESRQFDTQYAELGVGCEACHGPGSEHVKDPSKYGLRIAQTQHQQLNDCAQCHSLRAQWAEGFQPGADFYDHYRPALLSEPSYFADGQIREEVYVWGSFLQSKMRQAGVTCSDCHDAHSGQLRQSGNAVCTQCHSLTPAAESYSALSKPAAGLYDDPQHHFHEQGSAGAACVSCHMPAQTYMGIDVRHDHSFRRPNPAVSQAVAAPDVCTTCHADKTLDWAAAEIESRFGLLPESPFALAFDAAAKGLLAAELPLVKVAMDSDLPAIVRATALAYLAQYGGAASAHAVRIGLQAKHPLLRLGALQGARRWQGQTLWQNVRVLLQDKRLVVRMSALETVLPAYAVLPAAAQQVMLSVADEYVQRQTLHLDRAEAHTALASLYLHSGRLADAERHLLAATELNPDWIPALVNLADAYRGSGRDTQSGPLLKSALQRVPNNSEVRAAYAMWLVRQGDKTAALAEFRHAYVLSEDLQHAYFYAVALHSAKLTAQAFAVIDAVADAGRPARVGVQQLLGLGLSMARDTADRVRVERYQNNLRQIQLEVRQAFQQTDSNTGG